jgi:hypothetical protein
MQRALWLCELPGGAVSALVAVAHIIAATLASSPELPAEVVLAVAYVETKFDPSYTSRVEDGTRISRRAPSSKPVGDGPRFCGVMQTIAGHDWDACVAQRSLLVGYATGADELRTWLRYTRGDIRKALDGHGCGWYGVEHGCRRYAERVLHVARRLGWKESTS